MFLAGFSARARAQTWSTTGSGNWSEPANWVGSVVPTSGTGADLLFNAAPGQSYLSSQNIVDPFLLHTMTLNPASNATITFIARAIEPVGAGNGYIFSGAGTVLFYNPFAVANANVTTVSGGGSGTLVLENGISPVDGAFGNSGPILEKTSAGNLVVISEVHLYSLRADAGTTQFIGSAGTFTSLQIGSDAFSGTSDGGSPAIAIGATGSSATVFVSGSSYLNAPSIFVANSAGSNASLTVSGAGSQIVAQNRLAVNYGAGTISILNGASATAPSVELGRQSGSAGTLIVDGAQSLLTCGAELSVPLTGPASGAVRVTNGGAINITEGNAVIGFAQDQFGTILPSSAALTIAGAGSQMTINGFGQSEGVLMLGLGDTSAIANATLNINGGGTLLAQGGAVLGRSHGTAVATISGAGSNFTNNGELDIGSSSPSSISVSSGAVWENDGDIFTAIGSTDAAQISVAGVNSLADCSNANQFVASGGGPASAIGGATTINISAAGEMRAHLLALGGAIGSRATLSLDGAGSKLTLQGANGENTLVAADAAGSVATISIHNGAAISVSPTSGSTGRIILAPALASGSLSASAATMTIDGANSALLAGPAGAILCVGGSTDGVNAFDGGAATMTITNGASVGLNQLAYVGTHGTLSIGAGSTPASFRSTSLIVNGSVNFNSGTLQASGTMAVGGTVRLSSAARLTNGTPTNKKTLDVGTLSLTPSGIVDLNDNDAIFHHNTEAQIRAYIASARTGGSWSGVGLTSSAAAANFPARDTALAAITGQQYRSAGAHIGTTSFNGLPLANTDVIVKYTYNGDSDLDGSVTGSDYSRIDTTFNNEHTAGNIGGWFNGDFDYNGVVDGADYALIDAAFNAQIVGGIPVGFHRGDSFAGPDRAIIAAGVDPNLPTSYPIPLDERSLFVPSGAATPQSVPEPICALLPIAMLASARRRRHN